VNGRSIRGAGHEPVEHVQLAYQMALADAADRRVAAHLAYIVGAEADHPHARAAPRRGSGGLAASVSAPNDQHIEHRRALA
jgi:hypothetical protein